MALQNVGDIKNEVIVRLSTDTSVAYYTDTILNSWVNTAHRFATAYKRWPFTEGRVDTTYVSGQERYLYPEGWRTDSIRILQVGGKRVQKTNFEDYQNYIEDNAGGSDRIFTDFVREYYINPSIDLAGTVTVYGQYNPIIDVSIPATETVFTNYEEEGNEAIVEEMMAYALEREKKMEEAIAHHKKAKEILDGVYARTIKDEGFGYQTKNREMFKRINVIEGLQQDETFKRNQF